LLTGRGLSLTDSNPPQAEERLNAAFGDTTVPSLVAAAWKERLESMTYILDKVCCIKPGRS